MSGQSITRQGKVRWGVLAILAAVAVVGLCVASVLFMAQWTRRSGTVGSMGEVPLARDLLDTLHTPGPISYVRSASNRAEFVTVSGPTDAESFVSFARASGLEPMPVSAEGFRHEVRSRGLDPKVFDPEVGPGDFGVYSGGFRGTDAIVSAKYSVREGRFLVVMSRSHGDRSEPVPARPVGPTSRAVPGWLKAGAAPG